MDPDTPIINNAQIDDTNAKNLENIFRERLNPDVQAKNYHHEIAKIIVSNSVGIPKIILEYGYPMVISKENQNADKVDYIIALLNTMENIWKIRCTKIILRGNGMINTTYEKLD